MSKDISHLKFYKMYLANSKNYLLNHFKSLRAASALFDAELFVDHTTLQIDVKIFDKCHTLYPQFLMFAEDLHYTEQFSDEAVCFIGWRPYRMQAVKQFSDKVFFKEQLISQHFLTPSFSCDPFFEGTDVIVKCREGSFGKSIYGPFQESAEYPLKPQQGEYFEKFVLGKVLKISFWNDKPVFIEQQPMPTLKGNGKNTILELALKRAKARARTIDEMELDQMLAYQDLSLETVLAPGETILADFRYESSLLRCYAVKEIPLPNKLFKQFEPEFKRLGNFLYSLLVQQANINQLFYVVDAILTKDNKLWYLEANSNPTVHYCVYPEMLKTLCQL